MSFLFVHNSLFTISICILKFVYGANDDRPRIEVTNGDLIIKPAPNKNIVLIPNGPRSTIMIGDVDVLQQGISQKSTSYEPNAEINNNAVIQSVDFTMRLKQLEDQFNSTLLPNILGDISSLATKIRRLRERVNVWEQQLVRDHCQDKPCSNGGTCLSLFFKHHCLCSPGWEGENCDIDVNECRNLIGTELGCQNGATCINQPGSYECLCRMGWYGLHCTRKSQDCFAGDFEMCGHGSCVPVTTGTGIKCICDQGWTHNDTSITCLTDINECESYQGPRCSVNPKVECINLPGSFKCGTCPPGYEGDGYACSDVDECLSLNGGCSTLPMVTCHNTVGSRICGQCPPGYIGDGIVCNWQGSCNENRGGCHPSAQCIDNAGINGQIRQCLCPEGMTGDGVGIKGCIILSNDNSTCINNPCGTNGKCHQVISGYTCICLKGFGGAHCEIQVDSCTTNPCQNGGVCRRDDLRPSGFKCECTAQFSGDLCQSHSKLCGGVLDAEEGNIVYPLDNSTYNHNARCAWVIHTAPDKVINVTFSQFDIESNPDCSYDFLQIHDGRSSASQFIGRFCGDTLPKSGNIISSHNNIYLWFRSDKTVAKKGFALHWNSIRPECGGEINATTYGHIRSPGSPGKYPPNRDCHWHLFTNPGKRIELHFFELDLQGSANCSYDYLEIYDGKSISDPLLNKFCNLSQPAPLTSFSSDLLIHFHSDTSISGNGFQISYATVAGIPGCGGYYTTERGELVSPNIDGKYLHNLLCEYEIRTSPDSRIQLNFKSFRLETSVTCQYDYLKLYDGPSTDSRLVGKFCGHSYPRTYLSTSNSLFLIFKSDISNTAAGFKITYESVCSKNFTEDSGFITSPGYPLKYPGDKTCEYVIGTAPGRAIQLTFQEFDLEDVRWRGCMYDYLEVRDGIDSHAPLLGKFCGPVIPPIQTSTHNYLYIKMNFDHSVSGSGVYANYTTIDVACGGIYRETTGLINHPSDSSNNYGNSQVCSWILIAPAGHHIVVTWNRLELEESVNCVFDYIELVEINENNDKFSMGKYCGVKKIPALTTNTNKLNVTFVSDSNNVNRGFSMSYAFLNDKSHCGGLYATETGHIISPGSPGNYEANLDCTWIIKVAFGQQVQLNIKHFQLESGIAFKCDLGDYLEIRNGAHENAALIGKFCGRTIPKTITSIGNSIFLRFHSDSYVSGSGFRIEWNGAVRGCGGTFTSSSGTITSPNYPQNYDNNADCFYKLAISHGSQIKIVFSDLDLEHSHHCFDDYLEIFDGRDSSAPSLGRFCELKENSITVQCSSNYAYIKFRSDFTFSGKGFSLNYYTVCQNITLTGNHGIIESPDYPRTPPTGLSCYWNIIVPKGNYINVSFTDLNIHGPLLRNQQACHTNYIQLIGTKNTNKMCYHRDGDRETSIDNTMQVKFVTSSWIYGSGFRLEWTKYGCGGHIQKSHGVIAFDRNLPTSGEIECEWLIETPLGSSVSMSITDIYMMETPNCTTDFIEMYAGQNVNSPLITRVCNKGRTKMMSTTNFMLLKFKKSSSLRDVYFSSNFDSPAATCGGQYVSRFGVIYSKNYPKNYYNNLDCIWYLRVPGNTKIQFNIIELDLYDAPTASNSSSCGDQIRVYEGANLYTSNYSLLICPNSNISSYISNSGILGIQFISDSTGTAKGFKANFTEVCGGLINAKTEGYLTSYDSTSVSNCSWTIIAQRPEQKISLTITFISISKSDNTTRQCSSSFLRVLDGDDSDAPMIGEFCGRKVPSMIVSRGSALTIEHGSYVGHINGKFSAHYSTVDMACGGKLLSEEGAVASLNYPRSYPKNIDCEWILSASPGNKMYVTIEKFDVTESAECNQDYLEIRETNGIGRLLGVYCGSEVPTNTSVANTLYIKFHSGDSEPRQGFILHYGYVFENEILCSDEGLIASPLYPNLYEASGEYSWRISTAGLSSLSFSVETLEIPSDADCQNNLAIFDGFDEEAPLLKRLCGIKKARIENLITSSNMAYIKLTLYKSNTGALFLLKYKKTELKEKNAVGDEILKCGSNITEVVSNGGKIVVRSPNYPQNYKDNMNCEWTFKSASTEHLEITFQDFLLEDSVQCFADYVSIYTSNSLRDWKPIFEMNCNSSIINHAYKASNYLKIVFVTDMAVNNKGFVAQISSRCGSTVTDSAGVIEISWFDWKNSRDLKCEWILKARPGRTIDLHFEHFNISNAQDANCNNFVMLRNGETNESPPLSSGKYCGYSHESKSDIHTSSNAAYITYKFSGLTFSTFRLRFEERNIECGATVKLDSDSKWEVFSSPNYPSVPVPYTECVWKISGPREEIVRIDFIDRFDIQRDSECSKEYVEIRNGLSDVSPLVGRYCGDKPGTIKTNGNSVYIKYSTQIADPRNGFKANVSIDTCGGTLLADSGEITSPYYPHMNNFPTGTVCEWHVYGNRENIFKIEVEDSHIPPSAKPCDTNVTIKEKPDGSIPIVLNTFCGPANNNTTIETLTNKFTVTMYFGTPTTGYDLSDYAGFRLTFKASRLSCEGTASASEGYLTSPGYPRMTALRYCHWVITVPDKSRRVRLEIEDVNLDGGQKISLYNDIYYQSNIVSLPNMENPSLKVFESSGHQMAIIAIMQPSTGTTRSYRFKAKYSSNEQAICGGTISGLSGAISSPTIERSYYCEWHYIQGPENDENLNEYNTLFINGTIRSSSREPCRFFDPSLTISSKFIRRDLNFKFCQNSSISLRIPMLNVNIKAIQNRQNNIAFKLNYLKQPCGGVFDVGDDPINIIKLPVSFNGTLDCGWVLWATTYKRIQLTLKGSFKLDCSREYVKITHGFNQRLTLAEYCIDKMPEAPVKARYIYFNIEYHTEQNTSGIQLIAQTIDENSNSGSNQCGSELGVFQKVFSSPNYPKSYNPNEECNWFITTDLGSRISLSFIERFVIEYTPNCTKDALLIYDWRDESFVEMAKLCGRNPPSALNSTSNKMKVTLRTDSLINLDGFKAQWRPLCGTTFIATDEEQFMYSPGYPMRYPASTTCDYKIVSNEQQILLKVSELNLEGPYPSCRFDNLSITGFSNSDEIFNVILCGTEKPTTQLIAKAFQVSFRSDRFLQRRGFKLSYILRTCGGPVKRPSILSSGSGDYYEDELNCTWIIEAPLNKIIVLKFLYIDMENADGCNSDYVAVYDGDIIQYDRRLALLCGHLNSTTIIRSLGNQAILQFVSDFALAYRGFKVEVIFSYGESVGCGGSIDLVNSSSSFIESPLINKSVLYDKFLDCHWTVVSPPNTVIKIEFSSFHIATCRDVNQTALGINVCQCDFVELRDGFNPNSLVIDKFCGHTLPPVLVTSRNRLTLRLSTDGELESSGFKARVYTTPSLCGQSNFIVNSTTQTIKTPGYDNGSIPRGLHCTYTLLGDEYRSIHLQIKDLDVEVGDVQSNTCNKDRVVINQSPSNHNQSLGKDLILRNSEMMSYLDYFLSSFLSIANPKYLIYCGNNKLVDLFISGNIQISVITAPDNRQTKHRGLAVEFIYGSFCHRNYTEPQGRIRIYNTAINSVPEHDCYILITAPENFTISLYFMAFIPTYESDNIYLEIFDGNTTAANSLGRPTSDTVGVFSSGRYLFLFNRALESDIVSFDLLFTTTDKGRGCGGKINNLFGVITSPLYPDVYRKVATCEWEIETSVGTRLQLNFKVFDLGMACNKNFVEIVDRKGQVFSRYCDESPAIYRSNDNYVKIVFTTNKNNGGTGWVAEFIGST